MSALSLPIFATKTPVACTTKDYTRANVSRGIQEMEGQTVQVYGLYYFHTPQWDIVQQTPDLIVTKM